MITDQDVEKLKAVFATKDDLKQFATKKDLEKFATKEDLKRFATKDDLKRFATKDDLKDIRNDLKRFATKDDLKDIRNDLKRFATKKDLEVESKWIVEEIRNVIEMSSLAIDTSQKNEKEVQHHRTVLGDHEKRISELENASV